MDVALVLSKMWWTSVNHCLVGLFQVNIMFAVCAVWPTVTTVFSFALQGHITITNYLLNYFSGLDIERRNCHGFTALMKAAMQGRVDCVRTLMLAGGANVFSYKCTNVQNS